MNVFTSAADRLHGTDMSDTPNRPAAPPDVVSDTHSRMAEGTGPAAPASGADSPTARLDVVPGTEVLPRLHDYRAVRMIGAGAMGSVYLAEDLKLGRKAAIKTMRPELAANREDRERFVREARAAAAVEHENIVPVWGIGETADGVPFIAMPFLQGESLDARMRREPIGSPSLLVKVACEVAEGLEAAHAAGLIHRDIKPANIWLEGDLASPDPAKRVRRAKLLDFGLARSVDQSDMQLTATGAVLGTPAYMSPEQARGGAGGPDPRTDVFTLGANLFHLVSGQPPGHGDELRELITRRRTGHVPRLRDVRSDAPPQLDAICSRAMAFQPEDRYPTAEMLAADIRAFLAAQSGTKK
jgi:serine/threonine protein kinase